jgi:hypothetical protein
MPTWAVLALSEAAVSPEVYTPLERASLHDLLEASRASTDSTPTSLHSLPLVTHPRRHRKLSDFSRAVTSPLCPQLCSTVNDYWPLMIKPCATVAFPLLQSDACCISLHFPTVTCNVCPMQMLSNTSPALILHLHRLPTLDAVDTLNDCTCLTFVDMHSTYYPEPCFELSVSRGVDVSNALLAIS